MISIVVPAYNEEENIAAVIHDIEHFIDLPHELVIVNDHSRDRTPELVKNLTLQYPSIRLVENTRPGGFANALRTGFENARGDFVVPVMADLCDELLTVKNMFRKAEEGFDIICGCRYARGGMRLGGSRVKGFFSSFVGWSMHILLRIPTHDIANAFKMYSKKVLESIPIESQGFEISMEIAVKGYFSGFKVTEVPTVWKERTRGKSSFKMLKLFPAYLKWYLWGLSRILRR